MNTQRSTNGIGSWMVALAAVVVLGAGCEAPAGGAGGGGGLLGKVGSSLGALKKGNGTLSLDGAAESQGAESRPADEGPVEDGGSDEGQGPVADAGCRAACEHILGCVVESCPALGFPAVEDLTAVVDECAAACDGFIDPEAVASVNAMSCAAVWSELTFDDPDLNDACQNGLDAGYEDEGWDEGEYEDDGYEDGGYESEDEGDWDEDYGYDDSSDEGWSDDEDGSDDEDCDETY